MWGIFMEEFLWGGFLWGGFLWGRIFLCRSKRLDLCKREKYALNEWLNSFMTARLIWRQQGESDEGLGGGVLEGKHGLLLIGGAYASI